MQQKTIDYSKGKIYKIFSLEPNEEYFYLGSTTQTLAQRLSCHRYNGKREPTRKVCQYFNSIGWNCKIDLLEEVCCNSKRELEHKENEYIQKYKNDPYCLNTKASFIDDVVNAKREYSNMYRKKNPEKFNAYSKKYSVTHKDQIKNYHESNKEILSEKHKIWYLNNRDEIARRRKERQTIEFTCMCGTVARLYLKCRHEKSKKHLQWLENNKE